MKKIIGMIFCVMVSGHAWAADPPPLPAAAETKPAPAAAAPSKETPKEPTIITSERAAFDSQTHIAVLEERVELKDPSIHLDANKMIIFFQEEPKPANPQANQPDVKPAANAQNQTQSQSQQTIKRMEAYGDVVIKQEDKTSHSDQAVYTPEDGKVVLTGNPSVEGPQGTVRGEVITFYREQKKMLVSKAVMVIKGGKEGAPELFSKKPAAPAPEKPAPKP